MVDRRLGRRAFLVSGAAGAAVIGAACSPAPPPPPISRGGDGPYGPLGAADANGIQLPAGFTAREVARGDATVAGTSYVWHKFSDGGACFATGDGGWIYVSNSEAFVGGGASALRFSSSGTVTSAYRILSGTVANCAGGATPWGTWLSGEEHPFGRIWECSPTGASAAVPRPAMGVFQHEAAAVDPTLKKIYLTEDQPDGRLYRFSPFTWQNLSAGFLEVAVVAADGSVTWAAISDPGGTSAPTRQQVPSSRAFNGGEGIVWNRGMVFFATKGDDKVWAYNTNTSKLTVHYDGRAQASLPLHGVDNIGTSPFNELLVCEDHGNMEIVVLGTDGSSAPLVRVLGQDDSELAGVAFNPAGTRLYFASQRGGPAKRGVVYEVTGPFAQRMAVAAAAPPAGASVLPPVAVGPGAALVLAAAGGLWRLRNRRAEPAAEGDAGAD
jgi:secreted PhoX family phosphatase